MIHNDAWLAGIFEGEGCVLKTRFGGGRLSIGMVDKDVIDRVHKVAGCGFRSHQKCQSGKMIYVWVVARKTDVYSLARRLKPYLGKRRRVKLDAVVNEMRAFKNSRHGTKTHYPCGHRRSVANTYITPSTGRKSCRKCSSSRRKAP